MKTQARNVQEGLSVAIIKTEGLKIEACKNPITKRRCCSYIRTNQSSTLQPKDFLPPRPISALQIVQSDSGSRSLVSVPIFSSMNLGSFAPGPEMLPWTASCRPTSLVISRMRSASAAATPTDPNKLSISSRDRPLVSGKKIQMKAAPPKVRRPKKMYVPYLYDVG